ncbi:MAG TPA: TraR/DksA C4-type zinc finger protein [Candidatus Moranbacteria bacterium]|nr:TraR/DksA C4-type zinc finger protein [Candidatus Moranbacteria bacterium]
MSLDKKTLGELKNLLLKEKTDLENDLSRIARPVDKREGDYETNFEEIGSDKDDNATEVDQYTGNISVETTLERKLQDVLTALEKIEKGAYGICDNCKKEIDINRLRANPSARTCIKCS